MCRFALYLGEPTTLASLVTDPEYSIIHQSFHSHEREEPLNGDGFGVAWYAPALAEGPAVFKDLTPAWSNMNLLSLARVTESRCLLAHVRAATVGLPVTRLNCHPFERGRFAFMHNGEIGGWRTIRRRLRARLSDEAYAAVLGSTDSEVLFALFVDRYRETDVDAPPIERMLAALEAAVAEVEELSAGAGIEEPSLLNLALTDGRRALVTRYISPRAEGRRANSLYTIRGRRFVCEGGSGSMEGAEDVAENDSVVVASEPLTGQPWWEAVPANHVVLADDEANLELRPFSPGG